MKAIIKTKFRGTLISVGLLTVCGALALLLGAGALMLRVSLYGQIEGWQGSLRKYVQLYGLEPEADTPLRRELRQAAQDRRQEFAGLCASLSDPDSPEIMSPLAFKQELFRVQEGLRRHATEQGIALPQDLGFQKYEMEVPAPEQLQRLNVELLLLDDVLSRLIVSRISRVTVIQFRRDESASQARHPGQAMRAISFYEYPVQITFEASQAALRQCITRLARARACYIVHALRLMKHPSAESVQVVMDIAYIGLAHEE